MMPLLGELPLLGGAALGGLPVFPNRIRILIFGHSDRMRILVFGSQPNIELFGCNFDIFSNA